MLVAFFASATPPTMPSSVPTTPTIMPCTIKIHKIVAGVAPMVRKIAISACLSLTTMTKDETKLKAATAMINNKIRNIMVFSILMAWKNAPKSWVQFPTR